MVRFIRYVLRALNPKTAVTMDSRQVFRIRRWTVACVLAILVIAMVSCSVHGMKAHAQRAAQASQSATTGKTTAKRSIPRTMRLPNGRTNRKTMTMLRIRYRLSCSINRHR